MTVSPSTPVPAILVRALRQTAGWLGVLAVLLIPLAGRAEQPPGLTELYSKDGVLSTTLVAAAGKVHIGDLTLDGMTYNGVYTGPVLHLHPGDLLKVRLINRLSEPTNLHFHGMRGSPLGNGDNVHFLVQPHTALDYQIRIPESQPIGLYWYHAHPHGSSEHQIMGGLSGALVIEGPDPLPVKQRLFVLKDMVFDDDTDNAEIDDTLHGIVQSVNGLLQTKETMQPGDTQLWRFTNQSANRLVHIALMGHRFRIVGQDGEPSTIAEPVEVLDIPPGSRFDAMVDAGEPGQYALVAKGTMTGSGADRVPDRVIGSLDVGGTALPAMSAASVAPAPLPPDLRTARIDATRKVVFTETVPSVHDKQQFFVNSAIYDAHRMDQSVPLGNTEEWTIRNDSDDLHVFHIHQIGFQVVAVNGKPVPFTGYIDNVRIPERGEVTLRLPFTDPLIVGRFVYHCHVLKHEDGGMMANIEIYDPTPPTMLVRLNRFYMHVVWWWNGVPWSQCGLQDT